LTFTTIDESHYLVDIFHPIACFQILIYGIFQGNLWFIILEYFINLNVTKINLNQKISAKEFQTGPIILIISSTLTTLMSDFILISSCLFRNNARFPVNSSESTTPNTNTSVFGVT
ncbi:hypothetical protein V8G54_002474, partial [Vigna mungo]